LWDYVKNSVYQVKNNELQHLKASIRDAVANASSLDICRATKGAQPTLKFTEKVI
jgi:hypothetical protein